MLSYFSFNSSNRMFSYGEFKAEDQVILFVLILIVLAVEFCSYRLVLARDDLDPFATVVFLHSVSKVVVV